MDDIDWDSLFEDTDREEEDMYSKRANTVGSGVGGGTGNGGVHLKNCKTVQEKTANGISTKTVCSESSSTTSP